MTIPILMMTDLAFIIFIDKIDGPNHSCLAGLDHIKFIISFAFYSIFSMDSKLFELL
jgi:hypothetical protein